MLACPNINLPDWKNLVKVVGEHEAYKDYLETDGLIRTADEVLNKGQVPLFKEKALKTVSEKQVKRLITRTETQKLKRKADVVRRIRNLNFISKKSFAEAGDKTLISIPKIFTEKDAARGAKQGEIPLPRTKDQLAWEGLDRYLTELELAGENLDYITLHESADAYYIKVPTAIYKESLGGGKTNGEVVAYYRGATTMKPSFSLGDLINPSQQTINSIKQILSEEGLLKDGTVYEKNGKKSIHFRDILAFHNGDFDLSLVDYFKTFSENFREWFGNIPSRQLASTNYETLVGDKKVNYTALNKSLNEFLKTLGVSVEVLDSLKERTGYDIMGATDLVSKTIMLQRNGMNEAMPKESAYLLFEMLGRKNLLRKQLISNIHLLDDYQSRIAKYDKSKLNDYKKRELVCIDYLHEQIKNNFENPVRAKGTYVSKDVTATNTLEFIILRIKQYWDKFLTAVFKKYMKNRTKDIFTSIANDIVKHNYKYFSTGKTELIKNYDLNNQPYEQVTRQTLDYNTALENNPQAAFYVERLMKAGLVLSGSLALAKQGTIYRPDNKITDLDFTIPHSIVPENLKKFLVDTLGIPEEHVVMGKPFTGKNPNFITVSTQLGSVKADFFISTSTVENFKSVDGIQDWQSIFEAKIRIGRQKDMNDLFNFVPNKTESSFVKGLRHYNFSWMKSGYSGIYDDQYNEATKRYYSKPSIFIDEHGAPMLLYHGAGTKFDAFSKDYFLTGEGAMAFGAGFYGTTHQPTADEYAKSSFALYKKIKEFMAQKDETFKALIQKMGYNPDGFSIYDVDTLITKLNAYSSDSSEPNPVIAQIRDILNWHETQALYIHLTNPLQWNTPVRADILANVNKEFGLGLSVSGEFLLDANGAVISEPRMYEGDDFTEGDLYNFLSEYYGEKETSRRLYLAGIDGTIHETQGGRATAGFSHMKGEVHFVIFEPIQAKRINNSGVFSRFNANTFDPVEATRSREVSINHPLAETVDYLAKETNKTPQEIVDELVDIQEDSGEQFPEYRQELDIEKVLQRIRQIRGREERMLKYKQAPIENTAVEETAPIKTPFEQSIMPEDNLMQHPSPVMDTPEAFVNRTQAERDSANNFIRQLMDKLSTALGIKYAIVTAEEALRLTEQAENPWDGEPAFFIGGVVYFVGDKLTPEMVVHEFSHPLLRAIAKTNSQLFENLYTKLASTAEGMSIIATVKADYKELKEGSAGFKEECLVRALAKRASDRIGGVKNSTGFLQTIKNILFGIKQALRKMFGKAIKVENLNENTTLNELAVMLEGDQFQIDTTEISQADVVAYNRTRKEEVNLLKELGPKITNFMAKSLYQAAMSHIKIMKNNGDYAGIAEAFKDQFEQDELVKIRQNLSAYTKILDEKVEQALEEMDLVDTQASHLVTTLYNAIDVAKTLSEAMLKESANLNKKESVQKVFAYEKILRYWDEFIRQTNVALNRAVDNNGNRINIPGTHPFRQLISSLRTELDKGRDVISQVNREASLDLFREILQPLSDNIDQAHKEQMERLKKQGAPESLIKKYEDEYTRVRISTYQDKDGNTIDPILDHINGKEDLSTSRAVSSYIEAYMFNGDPLVAGFALFIKNNMLDVYSKAQMRESEFIRDAMPLLKKIGFDPTKTQELGKMMTFVDKIFTKDKDGNVVEDFVHTYLNPFKNYRHDVDRANHEYKEAVAKARDTNSDEDFKKAAEIGRALRKFRRVYLHGPYREGFHEGEEVFDDEVGSIAYEKRKALLLKIHELQLSGTTEYDEDEKLQLLRDYWKEYRFLHSTIDRFGKKKKGLELEIAIKLKTYQKFTRDNFEYKPIPGMFQGALTTYEQKLIDDGDPRGSKLFIEKRQRWLDQNTVTAVTDSYFKDIQAIQNLIKGLKELLPSDDVAAKEIEEAWTTISEALGTERDDDNQPDGSAMTPEKLIIIKENIVKIQELKKKFTKSSGFTREEGIEFGELIQKINEGTATTKDATRLSELHQQKKGFKVKYQQLKLQLNALYSLLNELQSKEPTDYYVDIINEYLKIIPNKGSLITSDIGASYITKDTANVFLQDHIVDALMNQSEAFKDWFLNNHYRRESFNAVTKEITEVWERTPAWNVTRPSKDEFYQKTDILDIDGNYVETITAIPNRTYFQRIVKPEHITEEFLLGSEKAKGKIPNKDIDGRWLPKTRAQGAPANPTPITIGNFTFTPDYHNQAYYDMQDAPNKDKFNVLQALTDFHLKTQEGLKFGSRLGLDIPRYRQEFVERAQVTVGKGPKEGWDRALSWWESIRSYFMESPDDALQGMNNDKKYNIAKIDLLDDDLSNVPITGLFKLPADEVSLDVVQSMMRYMLSAERQKKLIEISPFANAVKETLNSPDGNSSGLEQLQKSGYASKFIGKRMQGDKAGKTIRAKAINSLFEREFKGEYNTGMFSQSKQANAVTRFLFSSASFGLFALNIPSALKNSFSVMFQNMIMTAGGQDLDMGTYHAGIAWSLQASMQKSSDLYVKGPKSLNTQLIQLFDPTQTKYEAHKFGEGLSRTPFKDMLSMSWLLSPRKWSEENAALGLFGGMMKYKLIDQTINGTTTKIQYMDAWEIKNGVITLKEGIDKKYDRGGSEFKKMVNLVHTSMSKLNGAFAKFDQPDAGRNLIFRLLSFLRRYAVAMFANRWGYNRVNVGLGRTDEGFYRTNIRLLKRMLFTFTNSYKYMSPQERVAVFKMLGEAAQLAILWMLYSLFFGWDPSDEDRYKKLYKKSGPMPFLGFVEEDPAAPFDAMGYASNAALSLSMNVFTENQTWLNPKDYAAIFLDWKSVTFGPTVNAYTDILTDLTNLTFGNESAYYKKKSGPYMWQEKGDAKLLNHFLKMFGISGTSVDPVQGIKNWQSVRARQ
jgi:hypothetical protein